MPETAVVHKKKFTWHHDPEFNNALDNTDFIAESLSPARDETKERKTDEY
jgi:hypothetical protein